MNYYLIFVLKALTDRTEASFKTLLGPAGWLLVKSNATDPESKCACTRQCKRYLMPFFFPAQERMEELQFLRDIYIPECVFVLHRILSESSEFLPENSEKLVALSEYAQETEDGFYNEFNRSDRLQEFSRLFVSNK
jgi:hypothetical protein